MKMIRFALSICAVLCCIFHGFAQSKIVYSKPFSDKRVEKSPIRDRMEAGTTVALEFYDTTTNTLISSFDIKSNSPYINFSYEKAFTDGQGYPCYIISEKDREQKRAYWLYNDQVSDTSLVPARLRTSSTSYCAKEGDYAAVGYFLYTYDVKGLFLSFHATYHVFDNRGKIIQTFLHVEQGYPGLVSVTDDGKYMVVSSAEKTKPFSPDVEKSLGRSLVEMFQVEDQKKVYSTFVPEYQNAPYPLIVNRDMLLVQYEKYENEEGLLTTFHIIDIKNNIIYERTYNKAKMKTLHMIARHGVYFNGLNNSIDYELYSSFNIKKIQHEK
jgi:hypothetical protein